MDLRSSPSLVSMHNTLHFTVAIVVHLDPTCKLLVGALMLKKMSAVHPRGVQPFRMNTCGCKWNSPVFVRAHRSNKHLHISTREQLLTSYFRGEIARINKV